ncbi:MAG: phytanoyl-CoA dioxygenase family protein [Acidobacteria bacterium]|nr:phytanoyl-CoA dioxygenase family protein [Acidobacteriota bacterium]
MTWPWQESVEQNGFAILPGILHPREMLALGETLTHSDLSRSRAGIRHALSYRPVEFLAHDSRLLDIARSVLGDEAIPYRATFFDKSQDSNWLVVWHQDTALPMQVRHNLPGWGPWSTKEGILYAHAPDSALRRILTLRIHLDDCHERNGALRVLPGTHTRGVLNDDEIHDLAEVIPPVPCLVPQGGILVMRPLLLHSSSKSLSAESRRVLHIEYAGSRNLDTGIALAIA